jgi:hypothetical protein
MYRGMLGLIIGWRIYSPQYRGWAHRIRFTGCVWYWCPTISFEVGYLLNEIPVGIAT